MIFNRFKSNPLSLRWKWGIMLFLIFSLVTIIFLSLYRNLIHTQQTKFMTDEVEQLSQISVDSIQSALYSQDEEKLNNTIKMIEKDGTIIRLFDRNQRLTYETKTLGISTGNFDPVLKLVQTKDGQFLINTFEIDTQSMHDISVIQHVTSYDRFLKNDRELNQTFIKIGLFSIVVILGLAVYLSSIFFKPLHYLNNALDMVEEESLSNMRVKQPKNNDDWSDLIIHINKLLDRIDKYVNNQKQFVEDVSHELRTPVAIVEGHLKLLNRWGKNDPEIMEESIQVSLQEITRMKELVQEMLDLSRADHVDIDYRNEITEIYSTVRQIYNNFVILHPEFHFFLDIDDDSRDVFVQIYRNHFEQIFIILLDNAVKYSRDRKEIHISVSQNINNIEIAVQDFGEGMSEQDKEKVFSRFYRVDKARSRDKGGNGLGLSIAKQLVNGYKGKVRLESALNYGSIFYIEFPILKDTREIYKRKQIAEMKSL